MTTSSGSTTHRGAQEGKRRSCEPTPGFFRRLVGSRNPRSASQRAVARNSERPRAGANRLAALSRVLRRVHLYLGLLLMPWIVLFGFTALSFNHPGLARDIEGQRVGPTELRQATGVEALSSSELAASVAQSLPGGQFALLDGSARFSGWPLFVRPGEGGKEVVILGLEQGAAIVTHRPEPSSDNLPPFAGQKVDMGDFSMDTLAEKLEPLHQRLGIETHGPLLPHPKIHPELRFVVEDETRTRYNVVVDLATGTASGRRSEDARPGPFVEVLESLHKQHHYPMSVGPTFFWAIFSDLTALTLLIWAATGLFMWWQLKKLRVVGIVLLSVAAVLGAVVMGSTASELSFGPAEQAGP